MLNQLKSASLGILTIQTVAQVPPSSNTVEIIKLVLQAIVAIFTMFHVAKKKQP